MSAYEDLIVLLALREGMNRTAASHPKECRCDVCRAWLGDGPALTRVLADTGIKIPDVTAGPDA